jgi:sugar phosphate permease
MLVAADRANLGIAIPAIKAEFRITNAEAGLFATLMFVANAISQIPASILCRRFDAKYLMTGALLAAAAASYFVGTSSSPLDVKIFRSLLGVAEAGIIVCCLATINNWFSARDRGTATGFFMGASKLGPVVFPPISVWILEVYGWRAIFQVFAVPVLVAALVWYFFVDSKPEKSRFVSTAELDRMRNPLTSVGVASVNPESRAQVPPWVDKIIRAKAIRPIDSMGGVFRSWNLIGNLIATIFMVGIFNVFLAWVPSYLLNHKHFSLGTAGVLSSVLFAGAVAGNLTGGWISDKLLGRRRKPLMMLGALCTAAAFVCLIYCPANAILTGIFLLPTGFVVGLGYPHFIIYPMSLTTREIYPVAFGLVNTGSAIGAACFPLITGIILDAYSWDMVFVFLAGSALVCLAFLLTIEEPLTV